MIYAKVVVDASVLVSQASSQDVYHVASSVWLTRYLTNGGLLIEPEFVLIEVASAISRRTGQATFAEQVAQKLIQSATIRLITLDTTLLHEVIRIAANLGLRAGDALYVALAHQLGVPLISWDKEQLARADPLVEAYSPDLYPF